AIEAAAATKQYAFDVLNFPEVISRIRDTNLASMNVAIRNQMLVRDRYMKTYRGNSLAHYVFSVIYHKNED
ncbi:GNAT family N-acetyltransferase, partial [Enterococcus faecalis]|uniref:GNAT family N-acetyltransferase n=1 Tax=Enterococcus faecalis TaxID=1351 RepID=UPI003CC59185